MVDRGKKQILKQKQPFLNEFETSRLYFLMAFWWSGSSKVLQLSSEDKSSHDFLVYCIFLFKAFMGTKVFIGVWFLFQEDMPFQSFLVNFYISFLQGPDIYSSFLCKILWRHIYCQTWWFICIFLLKASEVS